MGRFPDRVQTSFALLQADWDVDKGLQLLERLKPTHAIVQRSDTTFYYLYSVAAIRNEIERRNRNEPLWSALDLHENKTTSVISVQEARYAPGPSVVHLDGRVVGFVEARQEWQAEPTRAARGEPAENGGGAPGPAGYGGGGLAAEPSGGGGGGAEEAAGAPAATAVETAPVERTLMAELPNKIAKGSVEWLLVSLSTAAEAGGLPVSLPVGTVIDVLVQPRRGVTVEGDPKGSLAVSKGDTLPIQFKVRGVELGPAQLRVLAFHAGQALGAVDLAPMVIEQAEAAGVVRANASESQTLAPIAVRTPDLALLIEERPTAAGLEYVIRVTTANNPGLGLNLKLFGPLTLKVDPGRFFQEYFQGIEQLPAGKDRADFAGKVAARGAYLFQTVFPPDLQDKLWTLRNNIQSVIIQSDEPWIPWEIFKFCGKENGRIVEGSFLCEAYEVTRWVPGLGFQQPLTMQNIGLVVPGDTGLPKAADERDYVLSLAGDGRKVTQIPATALDVRTALASGDYDCMHFTGHGLVRDQNPDRSPMSLQGGDSLLPQDISGTVANLGLARPLVFLNACQLGRSGMSLTGAGGWAQRFLDAGAGAFIGSYWSVYDEPAINFAKALYARLLGGAPIARAVKEARAAIKANDDATWLAYTVFADPLATIQA